MIIDGFMRTIKRRTLEVDLSKLKTRELLSFLEAGMDIVNEVVKARTK